MTPSSSSSSSPAELTRRRLLLGAASLGAGGLLAACGGDGGIDDDIDASPTESVSSLTTGPISGFGSVIVGGIRFDETLALIVDEDGNPRARAELRLGSVVDIDGGRINRTELRALAMRIMLGGALVGPVNAVDSTASTLTLLGQTVLVTSSTVFDDTLAGGLAAVSAGAVLAVHGLYDAVNKRFLATRVEPQAGATEYRLRGQVSAVDTAAKTFKVGSETVSYANVPAAELRTPPVNGQFVRVRLQLTQVNAMWVATHMALGLAAPAPRPDAHVEGVVTAFTAAANFEVNGIKIDASQASFPDGSAGIVLGARVEVDGAIVAGVLVATKVEIDDRRPLGGRLFEFHGAMTRLDTTAKTFALRGLTIWYGSTVAYQGGSEASLADGKQVEVRGVIAIDRTRIEARQITFS